MDRLRGEYVYTSTGRQRPVFLQPGCRCARFTLQRFDGDEARVEVSYDPRAALERHDAAWLPFEGGEAGGVEGATALRVVCGKVSDWMVLVVEQEL